MDKAYAQALAQLLDRGMSAKDAVQSVHALLASRGRTKLMPRIQKAFERLMLKKNAQNRSVLYVAKESDTKSTLAKLKVSTSDVTTKIDDTLIGGYRFENGSTLTDASFKKQLLDIYSRITSH